jgi:hypothetical protein
MEVAATIFKNPLSAGLTGIAMFSRVSRALSAALMYPSTIKVG